MRGILFSVFSSFFSLPSASYDANLDQQPNSSFTITTQSTKFISLQIWFGKLRLLVNN